MSWNVVFTAKARTDAAKLAASELKDKADSLLNVLRDDPHQIPPPFERLHGVLAGACSRRINRRHRLVYQILDDQKTVKVLRMWTHYG